MKRPLLWISICVAALVIIGIAMSIILSRGSLKVSETATLSSQNQTPSQITVLENSVALKKQVESKFTEIEKTADALVGDTLKTSHTGRALVESSGATTILDYDTELTFKLQEASG